MKRLFRPILIFICMAVAFSNIAYAENTGGYELCSVEISDGVCTLRGRQFTKANADISLKAEKQSESSASPTELTTVCGSDGGFELQFNIEYALYKIKLESVAGVYETEMDFSGISELFDLGKNKGFAVSLVSFAEEAVTIVGTAAANENIAMSIVDEENYNTLGFDAIKAVVQTKSDKNGGFELKFKTEPGSYKLSVQIGQTEDNCRYAPHTFIEELAECGEYYNGFLSKLSRYAETLEALIEQCEASDIPTDYESVNLGVIKRYIDLIENEANHEDFSRMGQYDYALTRLYREAEESLTKYLSGEKTAVSVPKYVTSELLLDGKSVSAMTNTGEQRPVFFTGFGNWETVAEEIPYFSEIGLNAIQTEINMSHIFVQDKIDVWGIRNVGESEVSFEVVSGAGKSGDRALKITNSGEYVSHKYKYAYQKIDVKPDTTYVYGLSAKGSFDDAKAVYFNMDGLKTTNRQYIDKNSDVWKDYSNEYTTAEGQTSVTFAVLAEHPIDEVYIDDVFIKEKGSDVNLIGNADFETVRVNSKYDNEAEELGFYINYEQIDYLRDVLETAEEYNMLVDIGVCPHYMPEFILDSDPEITEGIVGSFTPYSLEHPTVRAVASLYARLIASVLDEYESVHTLCLTNEPGVFANYSDSYTEAWQEYLREKYQTVDKLREVYGPNADFETITMPKDADEYWRNGFVEATPIYYDYRSFNDWLLADFHQFLAGEVKKEGTDLLLHTKIMDYFRYDYERYLSEGTNWELLSEYMDINGCDAHSYYENSNTPMPMKMAWYDFMTSVKNAPVWDTESHVIDDNRTITYSGEITNYIEAEIWNSAIHGRAAGIYWIWDLRDTSMPWGTGYRQNANFAMRPEETARIAKANLDLNRLSKEVTALQNAEAKTAILYSRTSQGYNTEYMNILGEAYEDLIYSGQKVEFVTDSRPEDMNKYELLIIPGATNVSADMLDCIKVYVENGGALLLLGENSLKRDEHNNMHDSDTVSLIYSKAETEKNIVEKVMEMQLSEIVIVDEETGEKAEDIEWSYAEYNGKMLVNIMNHDRTGGEAKTVKLMYGNKQVADMYEMRENEKISDILTVNPLEAKLISFDIYELDLIDKNGVVLEENIDTLKSGTLRCNTNSKGSIVLALYKDGQLINVSIGTGIIEVAADERGIYSLMVADWDMNRLAPNKVCRRLTMEVK